MENSFRSDDLNQTLLLPPSLHDWLPEKHLARFLVDVVDTLDLDAIYASYEAKDGRGLAAYAPEMMLRLLLYGYSIGVYSSRKIEARTHEDVAFRYLSADQHHDHDTIAEFRKRHLHALAGLFTQALLLCEKAGLVKLGHVAIDGTKIKANASKHKAMSYDRMGETEQRLKQEIDALLKRRLWVRLYEKGGKDHAMPCRHNLEQALAAYIDGVDLTDDRKGPLFQTIGLGTGRLTRTPLPQANAYAMIHRLRPTVKEHLCITCPRSLIIKPSAACTTSRP